MKIISYIIFNGNCEEALNFYKTLLNAEITTLMRFKDSPMEVGEDFADKIMHASLEWEGNALYACDHFGEMEYKQGNHISFLLEFEEETRQTDLFEKFAEGGRIEMPLENQFWGARFGSLVDKYGIAWGFHKENEEASQ